MNKWQTPQRIEKNYQRSLNKILRQITTSVGKDITDPHRIVRLLKQISKQKNFIEYCESASLQMVNQAYKFNKSSWRQAALQVPGGKEMYNMIQKELEGPAVNNVYYNKLWENVELIKSVPQDIAADITDKIQAMSLEGKRSAEINSELLKDYPRLLESSLHKISRTETSKTLTALTQARSQNLGINRYIWRTAQDSRRRKSHAIMEGVIVFWDNPPSPEKLAGLEYVGNYHAGESYYCRCYPEPIVSLDFVKWPCKVYHGGRIQMMQGNDLKR